ncbi:MAG TPA: hypothetical protein VGM37_12440 [Armatimonadota bacterium]|jgi:hypothetical protein
MRKFVVPIVALTGIALLSPHADAANLFIKSRAATPGHPVSLPVLVNGVGGTTQLWGVDLALTYDAAKLAAVNDATTGAAFTPQTVSGSTETPVVVSGAPTVGTVVTNPTLYVGYVRGTSAMPTFVGNPVLSGSSPSAAIGLLRLSVAAGTTQGIVVNLAVPTTYNVANDGTGSTTVARAGATGATSDVASGAAVTAETVTVADYFPNYTAPGSGLDLRVPLHKVAVGLPGDLNTNASGVPDGVINAGDLGLLAAASVGKTSAAAKWTEYARIAADVSPALGYTAANIGGTSGQGYGDGIINAGDLGLLAAKSVGKPSAANFPVPE